MWTGRIDIPDDGGAPRRKGFPPFSRLRIKPQQVGVGQELDVQHGPTEDMEAVQAQFIAEIGYCAFEQCPICLTPEPDSDEHVPHGAIGGQIRTRTCGRCNNMLGTRVEDELTKWCFDALPNIRAEGPGVQGRRRVPSTHLRWTDEGQFVLIVDDRADPAVRDMLASGQIMLDMLLPDRNRYQLAALKHAYLAACCNLRRIPEGAIADVIRADLIKARDAAKNPDIPRSAVAAGLGLMRSFARPSEPILALAAVGSRTSPGMSEVWISLAGTVLVQWPLPEVSPVLA
jgi:hypothetical protein